MKRPASKRKKQPKPEELAAASPFDPLPDPKAEQKQRDEQAKAEKKQRAAQAKADKKARAQAAKKSKAATTPQAEQQPKAKKDSGVLRKPLRALGGALRMFGKLGGKARVAVVGALAIVVVVGVIVLGGSRDDQKLVRSALTSYGDASNRKDYQKLCDDLLAASYVRRTASSGLPCEVALRTALEDVRNPKLEVLSVKVDGDRATARVRGSAAGQVPGEADYTLVREDGSWRILPPSGDQAPTAP